MKILVVHEVSYENKPVYEYQDFAERLASRGHEVRVVDFDEKSDGRGGLRRLSRTGLAYITLHKLKFFNLPLIKFLSAQVNYTRLLLRLLNDKEIEVIFLYSVFVNGFITILIARKYGIPIFFRVLDAYHKLHKNSLARILLYLGEKYIYRSVNRLCLTNDKMISYVTKVAGNIEETRISVIGHGVDTAFFRPLPADSDLIRKHGLAEKDRIAIFLGTTYDFSGLDKIVENFDRLRSRCENAKLLIVGGGQLDERLRSLVKEKNLEKYVILTGMRPYEEVPRYLSLAHVAFNSFFINDITRDIVPIKILQYLACGKPTLSSPIPDVVRLFPERESGMIYKDIDDANQFVELLGSIMNDLHLQEVLSKRALKFVSENYSVDKQITMIESLMFDLIQHG